MKVKGGCAWCEEINDDCILAFVDKKLVVYCRSCAPDADVRFWDVFLRNYAPLCSDAPRG